MKNIHILPTYKPSRLHFTEFFEELVFTPKYEKLDGVNIYITSDEQLKYNDYYTVDGEKIYYCNTLNPSRNNHDKKIILTTDPDLIKDGVQAIDDEFLEWFVKNPSCEEVDINIDFGVGLDISINFYKIIIPKEETKQRLEKYSERFDNKDNEIVNGIFNPDTWGKRLVDDEPKQETLEEVAENFWLNDDSMTDNDRISYVNGFVTCAKWMQERSYTEEEVLDLLCARNIEFNLYEGRDKVEEWFNQFRK